MKSIIKRLAASLSSSAASLRSIACIVAAALLLAACESKTPEVGGSYNEYFFRVVNKTTQADFGYSFSSDECDSQEFCLHPGQSYDWPLTQTSDLTGICVSDKMTLHVAALDLTTGTRVDLGSKTFFGSDNNCVVVTLKYFLGHYSVSYEYESRIN